MSVVGIQDFLSSVIAQVKPNTGSATAASVPAASVTTSSTDQGASLTNIPTQSLDAASLNNASSNVSQLASFLQVAQGGVTQVQALLQQLQNLAEQPVPGSDTSDAALAQIDSQFQAVLAQINQAAEQTTYNGASLLDGTSSGQLPDSGVNTQTGSQSPAIALPNLTTAALFGGNEPNLLTPEGVAQALSLVSDAQDSVDSASDNFTDIQNQVEYASANIQTAQTNIAASGAVLNDGDITGALTNLLGDLANQPTTAAQLQAANVPSSLLSLIQD